MKTEKKRRKAVPHGFIARAINAAIFKILIKRGKRSKRRIDENSKNAVAISEQLLMQLLDENKDTEYGKNTGLRISTASRNTRKRSRCRTMTITPPISRE